MTSDDDNSINDQRALNDWPQGKQRVLFPWAPQCFSRAGEAEDIIENIEIEGKQNSLFPAGPVITCFVIPRNSKLEKTAKKSFALRRLAHKFAAVSRSTTWSRASRKFMLLYYFFFFFYHFFFSWQIIYSNSTFLTPSISYLCLYVLNTA